MVGRREGGDHPEPGTVRKRRNRENKLRRPERGAFQGEDDGPQVNAAHSSRGIRTKKIKAIPDGNSWGGIY